MISSEEHQHDAGRGGATPAGTSWTFVVDDTAYIASIGNLNEARNFRAAERED